MIAIYARQSIDKKDSISIESQIEFCKREVAPDEPIKIYQDKGYSGKNIDRPSFQELLEDIKERQISKIIIYRLDRMSRSLMDFAHLIEIFTKYDVEFVSSTEKFDTSTPIGRAMLSIVMVFAQLERETIQLRIVDNYYERAKLGVYMGGSSPYGFDTKQHKVQGVKSRILIPNENTQHVIDIYNKYAYEEVSLNIIADYLNKMGVKTSKDKNWHSDKLSKLLRNPAYVKADADVFNYFYNIGCNMQNDVTDYIGENGLFAYGKTEKGTSKWGNIEDYNIVIGPHEGIIDSYTWLKVQYKLNKNKSFKRGGKSMYTWLSGLTKCMSCGYSMCMNRGSRKQEDGSYTLYLRCYDKTNNGTCKVGSVRVEYVEENVKKQLFNYINNINTKIKSDTIVDTKKINELKILITSKQTEISNLLTGLANSSGATIDYINSRINQLDGELKKLNKELSEEMVHNDKLSYKKMIQYKKIIPRWDELSMEDKKKVAGTYIDYIKVSKDKIDIKWLI